MKNVVLVGCGGYGAGYITEFDEHAEELGWQWTAVVDPYAASSRKYEEIVEKKIPVYEDLDAFFANDSADIAIIATPIMFHADQAVACLEHGCDVLLEKPVAGSMAEAERIREAVERTGRKLVIGFQWCADDAMLRFKKDVDAGRFGRLLREKALVLWPRDYAYYGRGLGWAGKCYDKDGRPIFDSIASNATAHYLFNELWVAGTGYQAASLSSSEWFVSRANNIETYDTVMIKGRTEGGAVLFFAASHAIDPADIREPIFEYEFEKGTAFFNLADGNKKLLSVAMKDGTKVDYGFSNNGGYYGKMQKAAAFFNGTGPNVCPIGAAIKHIELLKKLWKTGSPVKVLPEEELIRTDQMVIGKGNAEMLWKAYKKA